MRSLYIVMVVGFAAILCSCETSEDIVDFPRHQSRLTLNTQLISGNEMVLEFSRSLSVVDNAQLKMVNPDEMEVVINGIDYSDDLQRVEDGFFFLSDYKVSEGDEIFIAATSAEYGKIETSTTVPKSAQVEKVYFSAIDSSDVYRDEENHHYWGTYDCEFICQLKDPSEEENYYKIELQKVYTRRDWNDTSILIEELRPVYFNEKGADRYSNFGESRIYLSDDLFNGQEFAVIKDVYIYNEERFTLKAIVTSLNREAYLFAQSYEEYQDAFQNPFAEPVKVFTNVDGGYGMCYAAAVDTFDVVF